MTQAALPLECPRCAQLQARVDELEEIVAGRVTADRPGRFRLSDPLTSKRAALRQVSTGAQAFRILVLLEMHGGMIDEQIAAWMPNAAPSGVRTRRDALVGFGCVRAADRTRKTMRGNEAQVWYITELGRRALYHVRAGHGPWRPEQ